MSGEGVTLSQLLLENEQLNGRLQLTSVVHGDALVTLAAIKDLLVGPTLKKKKKSKKSLKPKKSGDLLDPERAPSADASSLTYDEITDVLGGVDDTQE